MLIVKTTLLSAHHSSTHVSTMKYSPVQVWAYANMGYDPGALLDAVAQHCEQRLREFSPQHVSNIVWAYAKLGKPCMLFALPFSIS